MTAQAIPIQVKGNIMPSLSAEISIEINGNFCFMSAGAISLSAYALQCYLIV